MATATANNHKTATTIEMNDFAQKIREQLLSTVQQGQKLSVDAAQSWVKAVSVLPMADLPAMPGIMAMPDLEAAVTFYFDVAADLLNAQREFALQLTGVLVALLPAKAV